MRCAITQGFLHSFNANESQILISRIPGWFNSGIYPTPFQCNFTVISQKITADLNFIDHGKNVVNNLRNKVHQLGKIRDHIDSETALDIYNTAYPTDSEEKLVKTTKIFTVIWGLIAISVACLAYLADNLIQLVNIIGSIFYGNVLGIFLLAFFIKWVGARAVLIAALITQIAVIIVFRLDWMPYLWLNLLGCGLVMLLAIAIQTVVPPKKA